MPCCRQNSCRVKPLSRHWRTRVNMYSLRSLISIIFGRKTTADQLLRKYVLGRADTYKYRKGTDEVQGISFEKDGVKFKGSAIDRKYSFAGIEKQLSENRAMGITHSTTESPTIADQIREVLGQHEQRSETYVTGMGLLGDLLNMPASIDPEPDPNWRKKKRNRRKKNQEEPA